MSLWFVIIFLVAVGIVLCGRFFSKMNFFRRRVPASLEKLYSTVSSKMPFEVFSEVWLKIGEAYSIDARLILPNDKFKDFNSFDSWYLGKGEETLALWCQAQHLDIPSKFDTTLELAEQLANQRRK